MMCPKCHVSISNPTMCVTHNMVAHNMTLLEARTAAKRLYDKRHDDDRREIMRMSGYARRGV